MTDENDVERQIRWETEGIRRAAEHYREATKARDPATLPSGQRLLREVIPPLIETIKAAQADAVEQLGSRGRASPWAELVLLLDAEKLAVIIVTTALRAGQYADSDHPDPLSNMLGLSIEIAVVMRDQIEFDRWEAEQKAAKKLAKQEGDAEHEDQLALFRKRYPNATCRDWAKWRRKIDAARLEPWDKQRQVHIGSALIHWLTVAAPHRFEVAHRRLPGGKTQAYLKLSDETVEMMLDLEARAAIARPRLMPMLIPPIPWHYDEDGVLTGGYLIHKTEPIRFGRNMHTAALLKRRTK